MTTRTWLASFAVAAKTRRTSQRAVLAIDPLVLKAALDDQLDNGDASPYRRQYLTVRRAALARAGQSVVALAALLDAIEDAIGVDEAAREGGFVQGFECCRQLLLGGLPLDVEVLPGGARLARPYGPRSAVPRCDAVGVEPSAEAEILSEFL
jgi:hypothetical protein